MCCARWHVLRLPADAAVCTAPLPSKTRFSLSVSIAVQVYRTHLRAMMIPYDPLFFRYDFLFFICVEDRQALLL